MMRSFTTLALLALPLLGSVFAEQAASPTKEADQPNSIYASAHEAFQDLLNALPEESLQAALSELKDFKHGVFESHHRGVEHVHDRNPALATKLIVAAVHDLKKRQTPSNNTTPITPPPSPTSDQPPVQSSQPPSVQPSSDTPAQPPTSENPPSTPTSAERAVIINVPQTTTNAAGQTVVQTSSVLSQVTASVPVTIVRTNSQGQAVTSTENRPAVIRTTTDAQGRTTAITSAAQFAPTAGEVRTQTDSRGNTFVTTYTPGGGKISSIKLITTTDAEGRPSTMTSYTFVDPAAPTEPASSGTGRPGLQNAAAGNAQHVWGVLAGVAGAVVVGLMV